MTAPRRPVLRAGWLAVAAVLALVLGLVAALAGSRPDARVGDIVAGDVAPSPPPTSRDVYAWPFAWNSIWNLPLATTARYARVDTGIGDVYPDLEDISVVPDAPVRTLRGAGSGRVRVDPALHADGSLNNCATLLRDTPDRLTVAQGEPLLLARGGDPSWEYDFPDVSLTGRGIEGCHGGSDLSGIGGTIRVGELAGNAPLRHALKIDLPCDTSCSSAGDGHHWPAPKADADYREHYRGTDPNVNMGTLLALPPDTDLSGITEPDVRKIAEALRTYGAYVVDSTGGAPSGALVVQTGAMSQFPDLRGGQLRRVLDELSAVTNNGPDTPGGGALDAPRRAPCAPPFLDGSGAAPSSCGAGSASATTRPRADG